MKKKILLGVLMSIMCMAVFTGCGNKKSDKSGNNKQADTKIESKEKIEIDQLLYEVNSEVDDGKRYVMMKLTNNSKYLLTGFEVKYKLKSEVTDEEKKKFYKEIQRDFELTDDDMVQLKENEISMHAETEKAVAVGETIDKINCYYFSGSYYLKNMDHFSLVEPDIVTVKFVDEGKIYTMYYDYLNKSYSYENETEPADQWTTREIGKKAPKPDAKYITADRDDDDIFMFDAYGFTMDDFNAYVDKCKEMGYTENERDSEGFYSADNKEGYNVYLNFEEKDEAISGTIESPKRRDE